MHGIWMGSFMSVNGHDTLYIYIYVYQCHNTQPQACIGAHHYGRLSLTLLEDKFNCILRAGAMLVRPERNMVTLAPSNFPGHQRALHLNLGMLYMFSSGQNREIQSSAYAHMHDMLCRSGIRDRTLQMLPSSSPAVIAMECKFQKQKAGP